MGIMSVLPKTAYQQGLPRWMQKFDKLDYYWPEFAHLGEQAIKRSELALRPTVAGYGDETFGYQSRYAEYKYGCSTVHGDMKDNLAFWHLGRIFDQSSDGLHNPTLSKNFISTDGQYGQGVSDRIFAVQDGTDTLWCQVFNAVSALRPMPYFGTPNL